MTSNQDISCVGRACTGCAACSDACPVDSISMVPDAEGFVYPSINGASCLACGKCLRVCPAVNGCTLRPISNMYAAFSNDHQLRNESSSGGVFSTCARYVVDHGGIVVGAAVDSTGHVYHRLITNSNEISFLQKSKYVQSDCQGIYSQIKKCLKSGRRVLFSGCPCQVAGLISYLGKAYDNLITMDLICHGVPSPRVWEDHVESITGGKPAQSITFRRKDVSARTTFSLDISAPGLRYKGRDEFDDPYMALFVTGSANRESCYTCKYASSERVGDVTIGDCASSNCYPQFYPWVQLSSISLNTEKARNFWSEVESLFTFVPIDYQREIQLNAQLSHPVVRPGLRDNVYRRIHEMGIASVAADVTPSRTIKKKIKRVVKYLVPNVVRGRLIKLKAMVHDR